MGNTLPRDDRQMKLKLYTFVVWQKCCTLHAVDEENKLT